MQVDGEAWVQPPGIVEIVHKNRAQMLTRDRVDARCCFSLALGALPPSGCLATARGCSCRQAFESTLKSWEDKRKIESYRASRPRLNSQQSMEYLTEEECAQVQQLGIVADTLISKSVPPRFALMSPRRLL